MKQTTQSVIIVGGGHVGLSFALMLSHFGIGCTLLEKNTYPVASNSQNLPNNHLKNKILNTKSLDVRNTALSRKTVQIYQSIGIWDSLQSHACRIDKVAIFEKDNFGQATLDKYQEKVESFGQVIENAHLGQTLLTKVRQNPLITLIGNACVVALDEQANSISLHLNNGQILTASLVVACDGQHSSVRQLINIDIDSHDYGQTGIVSVVTTDKPHNHTAIECFSPLGPLALLPLTDYAGSGCEQTQQGYRRSVVFICKTGEESRYLTDDDYFLKALNDTFGALAGNITQAGKRGAYPLAKVLAKQQVKNRVILMGNSAHTLHPVAGQGFNLCMRDAYYLANTLKNAYDTHQDLADPTMLAHYQSVRLSDQKRVILFCDLIIHGFGSRHFLVKLCRNIGLILFDKVPYIKPLVARFAMGLKSVD